MLNNITLVGHVGGDPEIKYLESGRVKATFNLATTRAGQKDASGKEITDWHRIELWGNAAESAAEHIRKGSAVGVMGELRYNTWETDDARKMKTAVIDARSWRFVGSKQRQDGQEGGRGSGNSYPDPYGDEMPY